MQSLKASLKQKSQNILQKKKKKIDRQIQTDRQIYKIPPNPHTVVPAVAAVVLSTARRKGGSTSSSTTTNVLKVLTITVVVKLDLEQDQEEKQQQQ